MEERSRELTEKGSELYANVNTTARKAGLSFACEPNTFQNRGAFLQPTRRGTQKPSSRRGGVLREMCRRTPSEAGCRKMRVFLSSRQGRCQLAWKPGSFRSSAGATAPAQKQRKGVNRGRDDNGTLSFVAKASGFSEGGHLRPLSQKGNDQGFKKARSRTPDGKLALDFD